VDSSYIITNAEANAPAIYFHSFKMESLTAKAAINHARLAFLLAQQIASHAHKTKSFKAESASS